MTCYYNAETFEQIFPWHHAAGDFVIKLQKNNMKMKLITVRQYAPMLENKNETAKNNTDSDIYLMLEAMLVFFLNLSKCKKPATYFSNCITYPTQTLYSFFVDKA